MSWKLGQLVDLPQARFECPTGKTPFVSKKAARDMARSINHTQRSDMVAFRCGYCEKYHIGHRRGVLT